jgi:NAD(P)-dependent dehydrogenase (short-subunit alcohol dehydrogenase family)
LTEGSSGRELDGSVALVTGGAIGIGRAICTGLAAAGAKVARFLHLGDRDGGV